MAGDRTPDVGSSDETLSLQERYAPRSVCFGCGPANADGLRIRSFVDGDEATCEFTPLVSHEAFPGVLSGGIIGTLLDCHCNWTAAYHLMRRSGAASVPSTVTAEYAIKMRRPTPTSGPVHLRAWVDEIGDDRAVVLGELSVGGVVTATCRGVFVVVGPGHPAYHRW
ncbi:MAG: PaaI family thioesterase [Anaerolineae bacterium]